MAKHRTPSNILELRGAFDKNPQRRRKDIDGGGPLGDAPDRLLPEEREVWDLLQETAPVGVLTKADTIGMLVMTRLVSEFLAGNLECVTEVRHWLTQYGYTAAARAKLSIPTEKPKSKFSEFKAA